MAQKMGLVSIVVPVYNVEKYLRQTLDSVCEQTYPAWELLLVDDGSADNSGHICDEYAQKDARIHVFHTENRGVSCARNLGIDNAEGRWITFLDSDDYYHPECIEKLVQYANSMDMVVYSTQNIPSGQLTVLADKVSYYSSLQDTQKELDRFRSYFYSSIWNKLYLREKVTMRFNTELSLNEDWWFNVAYMQNCHAICVLPDVLNYHRVSTENSLTKQFRIHAIDDGQSLYYAQRLLYGDSQKARCYMTEGFGKMVVQQSIRLARSKQYSMRDKKAILDSWANHDFWMEEALDLSVLHNKRHKAFLNMLKRKKTRMALILCQVFAVILEWKARRRKES